MLWGKNTFVLSRYLETSLPLALQESQTSINTEPCVCLPQLIFLVQKSPLFVTIPAVQLNREALSTVTQRQFYTTLAVTLEDMHLIWISKASCELQINC